MVLNHPQGWYKIGMRKRENGYECMCSGEDVIWAYLMPAGIAVSSSKGRAASALVCDEPKFLIIAA